MRLRYICFALCVIIYTVFMLSLNPQLFWLNSVRNVFLEQCPHKQGDLFANNIFFLILFNVLFIPVFNNLITGCCF